MNALSPRPLGLDVYTRVAPRTPAPDARPAPAPAAPEAAPPAKPSLLGARGADLSTAEQSMIARYFPERPALALRLYTPAGAQSVAPGAVGGRLDLKG